MPVDTTVKNLHSSLAGAPQITGVAGDVIAVMDACLINGWGLQTADSLVILGGVGTVTRGAGHSFEVGTVVFVAGATITGGSVNGEQKALTVTATTWTFDATGLSNQTATGTITQKFAPLGWLKPFSGTNLAVYRSADVTGTQFYLNVDDTSTIETRVRGYEVMTAVNTGTSPFPTVSQQAAPGAYWSKFLNAGSKPWMIVGDGKQFIIYLTYYSGVPNSAFIGGFGDFISKKSPDPYCGALYAANTAAPGNSDASYSIAYSASVNSPQGPWVARGYTGQGSSVLAGRVATPPIPTNGAISGVVGGGLLAFPNLGDNSLYFSPMYLWEYNPTVLRGVLPGPLFLCNSAGGNVYSFRDQITGVSGYPGRVFKALSTYTGVMFVDTTGPWR